MFIVYAMYTNRRSISRIKLHETELTESRARFSWLYRNSPVPYVTINARGTITLSNLAAIRLFKLNELELASMTLASLFTGEDENALSVILGKLQSGVTINDDEVQIFVSDNSLKWVLISVFSYGNTNERLVSLVDITKQKQIDAAKSEFVSLASHQLRTPIAAIRWNLELLGAEHIGVLNEKQTAYYGKISRNANRMVMLIDDFLSVSKLELGTFATESKKVNLATFFDDVLDEFQARIQTKKLVIEKAYVSPDYILTTDVRLLHIVASNLISNAVKYTGSEGAVEIGFQPHGEGTVITIRDTGFGIPETEAAHLFSKFFRASNARKHVSEGTGLGLYIVKQSVLLMGGSINVESKENVGTSFIVTLPK
jgi:PAS domain S-box-containing protein